ncbi:MAG: alpha/beta fold hydrolase [Anaerolineae bacterium]
MPYQEINGIRLRYETWGVGETPLLLLHGLGSSADDWFMQLPAFAPYFRCIAPDLRGHGLSDKPDGPYSVALFAADAAALLTALGAMPAHVLGLSLGGMVAQQLAIAYPHLVRSLVLINTMPGIWPPSWHIVQVGLRRLAAPWRTRSMAEQAARVAADLFPHQQQAFLRAQVQARLASNDPEAYRKATMAVAGFRPGRALHRLACPVLIIAGEEDRVVPRLYQERLRRALPAAEFVLLPGVGHACNVEAPDAVNGAVLKFLQRLEAP